MKRIFLTVALAMGSLAGYSQTDDKGYEEGKWVLKGITGINMSQTAVSNWSAGGENSFAGNAYLNGSLTHKRIDEDKITGRTENIRQDRFLHPVRLPGKRKMVLHGDGRPQHPVL